MPNVDNQTIELAFIAVAALALILQTIFVIVLVSTISKAARSTLDELENLRSSVMPIIYNTREVVARVAPRIEEAADELAALTRSLRAQTGDVQLAATEIIGRAQRVAGRVDEMASTVLDSVERAAEFVTGTVAKPVRQASGILASIKAIVESLRTAEYSSHSQAPMGRGPIDHRAGDKDMFV